MLINVCAACSYRYSENRKKNDVPRFSLQQELLLETRAWSQWWWFFSSPDKQESSFVLETRVCIRPVSNIKRARLSQPRQRCIRGKGQAELASPNVHRFSSICWQVGPEGDTTVCVRTEPKVMVGLKIRRCSYIHHLIRASKVGRVCSSHLCNHAMYVSHEFV